MFKLRKMETNILLLIRHFSRRRINIGPHSSGNIDPLIRHLTREQVEFLPSAPLCPTPAPPWATGTIRCTQPTWRALSFFRLFGRGVAAFRSSVRLYQFEEALSRCVYIGVLGRGLFVQSDVQWQSRVGSTQAGPAGCWWSVIGIEPAAFLAL